MTLVREQPELDRPVEGVADLIEFFRVGEKPRDQWRVGTEHEKLGLIRETLQPITYGDRPGLRRLLETFVEHHGFAPLLEGDQLVGTE